MGDKRDFVMVTVSGPDQPGITAAFGRILVENQVEIVDIEQASLQDFLGLSFLLDMSGAKQSQDGVLKDLLFEASRLHLTLNFRLFSEKEMKARNSKNLFILNLFWEYSGSGRDFRYPGRGKCQYRNDQQSDPPPCKLRGADDRRERSEKSRPLEGKSDCQEPRTQR